MKLSIVSTLYQSEPYINEFYRRISISVKELVGEDYEIVLVNDGSPDNSLDFAVKLSENDDHVVVVDLSRNFGHHKAMMTGLGYTSGERIFLIDSDLEEDPEWALSFSRHMDLERSDVVYGVQEKRRGGLFEKISGRVFYKLFRLLTGITQPNNIVTARLMSRRYVDAMLLHRERELNIGGIWMLTGFLQCFQKIEKRASSPTTYPFRKRIGHFVNAITSFSTLPLVFTCYLGFAISFFASLYILILTIRYFYFSAPPSGYSSIIASIWLLSGLIILFMGIQGIYISKIFSEVKQRPYTIIRQVYKRLQPKESQNVVTQ